MRFASAKDACETIESAIAFGINHIETAPAYGTSEQSVGAAIQALAIDRQQIVLTTKLLPSVAPNEVEEAIERSLIRLKTDYIDCLAIHGINTDQHLHDAEEKILPALQKVLASGKVRHVGFSTHGPLNLILRAIATNAFSFVNLHYNFFFQRNAAAIAQAHQRDMGIFIISPADKAGMLYTPPKRLKELCVPYDPLLLNYRWLLSDARITTLSVGPATPDELTWPLQVADDVGELSEGEVDAIAQLTHTEKEALSADLCAQCYRCLPCPEEINIPAVLRLRNMAVAYDMKAYGQYRYNMFENAGHWFSGAKGNRCTDCGDCLPRCPQQLDIPHLLRDTHERLKGKKRRRLWDD